jgi:hypothetical protein
MGWKKFKSFLKKVAKPVAAIAAIAFPPLIPAIGTALGASAAAASVVGAAALGAGASLASGDSLKTALTTGAISGLTAGVAGAVSGGEGLFSGGGASALDAGMGVYPTSGLSTAVGGTGLLSGGAGALSSEIASSGLTGDVLTKASSATGLSTDTLSRLGVAGVQTLLGGIGGGSTSNLGNLISGGLGTAGSLLQMQQSKEAAQKAQVRIDAETAAAKQAAAFRPVGMTTRFGTSKFEVDPTTGQLTSAGYTLSPEAKAQQDRFVALSNQGLTQAEQAQSQFAPLQTGAQSLFSLGNKYLAQSPEAVAQNYLNQQMSLLQPGRELELANLQNRLQAQGRGGLAVAQGGSYGATTPELQALYNARAMQEAQLGAQAQQAGQQQVLFGAGLLGQGSQAMGQYYGGQQAAYAPYTAAQGQVQNLEQLGQQPLSMGAALGQQSSLAGARVGQLGLTGAQLSTNLATGANATANPYAQALMAAGNPSSMFGQALGNVAGGLFSGGARSAFSQTGLGSSGFGSGLAYGNQDLGVNF